LRTCKRDELFRRTCYKFPTCLCVCVQTAEEKIQTPTTETEGDTDDDALVEEVRETNAYPMITLSVDSETEAEVRGEEDEGKEEDDPTTASSVCSP